MESRTRDEKRGNKEERTNSYETSGMTKKERQDRTEDAEDGELRRQVDN
jgi:hypothetical protein